MSSKAVFPRVQSRQNTSRTVLRSVVPYVLLLWGVLTCKVFAQGGSDWRIVGSTNRDVYSIDAATIKKVKSTHLLVWVRVQPKPDSLFSARQQMIRDNKKYDPTTGELVADPRYFLYSRTVLRYEVDCEYDRMKTLSWIDYDENGTPIKSKDVDPEKAEWGNIIPDSMGAAIENEACGTKK